MGPMALRPIRRTKQWLSVLLKDTKFTLHIPDSRRRILRQSRWCHPLWGVLPFLEEWRYYDWEHLEITRLLAAGRCGRWVIWLNFKQRKQLNIKVEDNGSGISSLIGWGLFLFCNGHFKIMPIKIISCLKIFYAQNFILRSIHVSNFSQVVYYYQWTLPLKANQVCFPLPWTEMLF